MRSGRLRGLSTTGTRTGLVSTFHVKRGALGSGPGSTRRRREEFESSGNQGSPGRTQRARVQGSTGRHENGHSRGGSGRVPCVPAGARISRIHTSGPRRDVPLGSTAVEPSSGETRGGVGIRRSIPAGPDVAASRRAHSPRERGSENNTPQESRRVLPNCRSPPGPRPRTRSPRPPVSPPSHLLATPATPSPAPGSPAPAPSSGAAGSGGSAPPASRRLECPGIPRAFRLE